MSGELTRYFRRSRAILYFDVSAENSDYEVGSVDIKKKLLSCSGEKRRTRHLRERRFAWLPTRERRDALEQLEENFCISPRSNSLHFLFIFLFPPSIFLPSPGLSQGGSQSFGPVSLILSCLPAKLYLGCFLPPSKLPADCYCSTSLPPSFSLFPPLSLSCPLIFHSPPLGEKCTLAVSPVDKDTKEYAVHLRILRSRATGIFHTPWVHVVALRSVFITDRRLDTENTRAGAPFYRCRWTCPASCRNRLSLTRPRVFRVEFLRARAHTHHERWFSERSRGNKTTK